MATHRQARTGWLGILVFLGSALLGIRTCQTEDDGPFAFFPDDALFQVLLDQGVDRNGDGLISLREAESVKTLTLPPAGIRSLEGLTVFSRLDSFSMTLNPMDSASFSALPSLRYLSCTSCELKHLEVGDNGNLETLIAGRNSLESLDLSGNGSLRTLVLNNNLFAELDLSHTPLLEKMISCGNRLPRLDVSMLSGLTLLGIDNMPMLEEVLVWTLPFPPAGLTVLMEYSPAVQFYLSGD
ncbi:MAG: hypothetical protein R2751_01105 [Bacteroidales bacterium]